jgi:hypothetical protein
VKRRRSAADRGRFRSNRLQNCGRQVADSLRRLADRFDAEADKREHSADPA